MHGERDVLLCPFPVQKPAGRHPHDFSQTVPAAMGGFSSFPTREKFAKQKHYYHGPSQVGEAEMFFYEEEARFSPTLGARADLAEHLPIEKRPHSQAGAAFRGSNPALLLAARSRCRWKAAASSEMWKPSMQRLETHRNSQYCIYFFE